MIVGVFAITNSSFSFFFAGARRFSAPDRSIIPGIDPSSLRAEMGDKENLRIEDVVEVKSKAVQDVCVFCYHRHLYIKAENS